MNCTLDLQTRTYTISEKPTNIIVIGDIHGKYDTIKMLNKSNNYAIIIVAGDCGFGFDHIEKDKSLLRKLQILFSEQGNQLFFVRGNHDNPHMFNAALHDYPHVHLAADYSIINIEPLLMEILLIGGAISIDRILRIYGKSYWPDEDFPFNPEILNQIKDIDYVVTHDCCEPMIYIPGNIDHWLNGDGSLQQDLDKSHKKIRDTFDILATNNKIKYWIFGHHHKHLIGKYDDIYFIGLNIEEYHTLWKDFDF